MPSTIARLTQRGLIRPPSFLPSNVMYETIIGSIAYGVSSDDSDRDIYGFCIPPKIFVLAYRPGIEPNDAVEGKLSAEETKELDLLLTQIDELNLVKARAAANLHRIKN